MKQGNFGDREWVGVATGRGSGGLFHVIVVVFLGHQVLSVVRVARRYRWHGGGGTDGENPFLTCFRGVKVFF